MFLKEDYLNEKYLRKRSYYLCCLASKLQESYEELSIDPDIQFAVRNNTDKPLLLVKSSDEKLKKYQVFIHAIPESGIFKEARFSPSHNNVRYSWYFNTKAENGKENITCLILNIHMIVL